MRIEVLDAAQQDLVSGYTFYESQSHGLGSYFLDSLFSDIDSLRLFAGVHEVHFGRYHRLLAKRFPFAIYYKIETDDLWFLTAPPATKIRNHASTESSTYPLNGVRYHFS